MGNVFDENHVRNKLYHSLKSEGPFPFSQLLVQRDPLNLEIKDNQSGRHRLTPSPKEKVNLKEFLKKKKKKKRIPQFLRQTQNGKYNAPKKGKLAY